MEKAIDLQAAQRRLEEKRVLLKQTDPAPISLVKIQTAVCEECKQQFQAECFIDICPRLCPDCGVKSAALNEERERLEADQRNERARLTNIASRLKNLSIGERFMGMVFDDYKPSCEKAKLVFASCREYVDNFNATSGSILMIGSPGTGKNMLAAIIAQEIIKRGFPCLHTTAMKLVRRVKESWRDKEESEQEVINSFVGPSLLIIDEIGVQFGSATEQLFLTEIINERYEKRRPTILISNLKLSQLTEVMGERVIDRFYDDGSKFLIFDWPSYRRKGQN